MGLNKAKVANVLHKTVVGSLFALTLAGKNFRCIRKNTLLIVLCNRNLYVCNWAEQFLRRNKRNQKKNSGRHFASRLTGADSQEEIVRMELDGDKNSDRGMILNKRLFVSYIMFYTVRYKQNCIM